MIQKIFLILALFSLLLSSCAQRSESLTEDSKNAESLTSETGMVMLKMPGQTRYDSLTHKGLSYNAAKSWGLSEARAQNIMVAAIFPDEYQNGIDHFYNQQWSHAYMLNSSGSWMWGDADQDYEQNLIGPKGGEGYDGKFAGYYYSKNDQYTGDAYVGYAMHYIEDGSIVVHTSFPSLSRSDILTKHLDFETWLMVNTNDGHKLFDAAIQDNYYYPITGSLKNAFKSAAWNVCYWNSKSDIGKKVWDAYRNSGYPTKINSGSADLVYWSKKMLIEASRWAKGTVKYAMDYYGQWNNSY